MLTLDLTLVFFCLIVCIIITNSLIYYLRCKKIVFIRAYTFVFLSILPATYIFAMPFIREGLYILGIAAFFAIASCFLIANIKLLKEYCFFGLKSSEVFAIFDEKVTNLDPDEKLVFSGNYGKVEIRKDNVMEGVWYARFPEKKSKIWFKEKISIMRSSVHCGIISFFVIIILVFSFPALMHFFYFN